MRDHLGEFYDKTSDFQQEQFNTLRHLIEKNLPDRADIKTLIDIGAGTGARTRQCFDVFPALTHIFALEPDHDMIETARQKYADPRIVYIEGAAKDLPLINQKTDCVISNWSVHWIPDKEKMMRDINQLTAPGTHLAFSTCERLPAILSMVDKYIRAEFLIPAQETPFHYLDHTGWINLLARHGWEMLEVKTHSIDREEDSAQHYLNHWFTASAAKFLYGRHIVQMNQLSLSDLVWMMNRAFPSKRHENGICFSEDVLFFIARRK